MHSVERAAIAIRRSGPLRTATPVWNAVRPVYIRFLSQVGKRGLLRNMNGTDPILIAPELYNLLETYEPEVWRLIVAQVRSGDVVADIGAFIGLYAMAIAKRVGPRGRVFAFEPDPKSRMWLSHHVKLNHVEDRVEVLPYAIGDHEGDVPFSAGHESQSHVVSDSADRTEHVRMITLDSVFAGMRVDLLKIDVEGFEEFVVRGAGHLLGDAQRAPRTIFVEVHPSLWPKFDATSATLLNALSRYGYNVTDVQGQRLEEIVAYGEIVARRRSGSS